MNTNCKKKFTNLGEDFLEITMFWDEKLTKMRQIQSKDFFLVFTLKFRQIFFHTRKVPENQDSGKRHKIRAKPHCSPNFSDGAPMTINVRFSISRLGNLRPTYGWQEAKPSLVLRKEIGIFK